MTSEVLVKKNNVVYCIDETWRLREIEELIGSDAISNAMYCHLPKTIEDGRIVFDMHAEETMQYILRHIY